MKCNDTQVSPMEHLQWVQITMKTNGTKKGIGGGLRKGSTVRWVLLGATKASKLDKRPNMDS